MTDDQFQRKLCWELYEMFRLFKWVYNWTWNLPDELIRMDKEFKIEEMVNERNKRLVFDRRCYNMYMDKEIKW